MSEFGTFETSRDVGSLAAVGGKAEVARTSSTDAIDPTADSSDLQNGKVPATARCVRWYLAAHSRQGISKLTHVSSRVKIRAKPQPGP